VTRDGNEIIVSGGGRFAVSTDELSLTALHLRLVDDGSRMVAEQLRSLQLCVDPLVAAQAPALPGSVLQAASELEQIARTASELELSLRLAAEAYGAVERGMVDGMRITAGMLGNVLGHLAPFLLLVGAPFLAATGLGLLTSLALQPGGPRSISEVGEWARRHPELANNTATSAAVRLLFSSSDDIIAGLLGVPAGVGAAIGDDGLRLFGIRQASGIVLGVAGGLAGITGGRLTETPVRTTRVTSSPVTAPATIRELAERMPATTASGPQLRVEQYRDENGASSWILYLGGTVDMDSMPAGEAFDMTSNIESMSAGDGASYRAAVEALSQAGVQPGDPVFEVGYSQGGLLAVQLEQSGDYNIQGVVTLGSPVGQLDTTAPTLTVAHTEDLVPALGGLDTATGDDRVLVRRELYDDAPMPIGDAFPSHDLDAYRQTAGLVDGSSDPRVEKFIDRAAPFLSGDARGTATEYRAERPTR
jgi:hypothetical protein